MIGRAVVLPGVALLLGCTQPVRRALPAPFPLVGGAVPVPAHGIALPVELNHGLRGQELDRTQIIGAGLATGIQDAFSFGLYLYGDVRRYGGQVAVMPAVGGVSVGQAVSPETLGASRSPGTPQTDPASLPRTPGNG